MFCGPLRRFITYAFSWYFNGETPKLCILFVMFKNLCSCSIFLEGNESTSLLDVFSELILHRQEMSRKFSRQQNIKIKPWSRNWRALKRVRSFNLIFVRRSSSILLFSFFEVFKNWHWHLIELALVLYWNLWCCKRRYVTRYNVWKFHHLFACLLSKFRLDYSRQFQNYQDKR